MANERKTENIVRQLLAAQGYTGNDNILVEEQSSDNPKIDKLLKNASKSGAGKGYPEFIISFRDNPKNIVVIECKASVFNHESEDRKQYGKYAVDGVLLYASYLKDDFNVMAIAVSGETEPELKISHHLWLMGKSISKETRERTILDPGSLFSRIGDESKVLNDEDLIKRAIGYNTRLHSYSIPVADRCTVISSILVALQDEAFLQGFNRYHSNEDLIDALLFACKGVLRRNNITANKSEIILREYGKIKSIHTFVSENIILKRKQQKNTVLYEFIDDVRTNIMPYINKGIYDILGQFYTQFIRYAGSDSKTGLVLTPPHITDFFCEISDINENDIVYDPCCGTGGFLVSAMNCIIKKSGNDSGKHTKIKTEQLLGVEKRSDMFSHACSNMMMRGDGKSQIHFGDCFDQDMRKIVTEKAPTKVFLNPPYDVGPDGQLEFIETAMEGMAKNGICVAICQMSAAISANKSVVAVKERMLRNHTLDAVLSMPDDLFHPIGVITCILIFKAHTPHSDVRKTFFGYFKDDGFVKMKHKGRFDVHRKWQDIQKTWQSTYLNRDNIPGLCVTHQVNAHDEWCAETYMETDYSTITEADFARTVRDFTIHKLVTETLNNNPMPDIERGIWKSFRYDKIFEIKKGNRLTRSDMNDGATPFIGAIDSANGIRQYVDREPNHAGNTITVNYNGSVAAAFYQPNPYFASDDVNVLYPRFTMTPNLALFVCALIKREKFRFNYGRKWHLERMGDSIIRLPVDRNANPDWQFMEDYIRSFEYAHLNPGSINGRTNPGSKPAHMASNVAKPKRKTLQGIAAS